MLNITENVSLKTYNSFGIEAKAKWFTTIESEDELLELFSSERWKNEKRFILGGGSNVLFTHDFDGLIIKMNIGGLSYEQQGEDVFLKAGSGIVWNHLVNYAVENGFAGLENLSLIPGTVGAAPVQNIGAYGVELKDVFYSCRALLIDTGEIRTFEKSDCNFSYRDSIFKSHFKGSAIITEVSFKLSTRPSLNLSYGAIALELQKRGIDNPAISDVAKVVSDIRVGKLPDPSTIGNAGSFFKNPIVSIEKFEQLKSFFPDIVHYCMSNSTVKLAAGWLIEQCGWKGKIIGNAGTWKHQALVLVNMGNASGSEIYDFSHRIICDVLQKFDVELEREVNIL